MRMRSLSILDNFNMYLQILIHIILKVEKKIYRVLNNTRILSNKKQINSEFLLEFQTEKNFNAS